MMIPPQLLQVRETAPPWNRRKNVTREQYQLKDGRPTLRHWRGGWWEWRTSHWVEVEQRAALSAAYEFTEHAFYEGPKDIVPWSPNRHKVADLLEALAAICHLSEHVAQRVQP